MEERFEAFTVLISRISRSIRRIKSEEMAEFQLKGPHVSCLYYLSLADGATRTKPLCPGLWTIWKRAATSPAKAAPDGATGHRST